MARLHLSATQTKRSAGQSAIASAAYRAGERLYSEYYGEYSDYTRKGGIPNPHFHVLCPIRPIEQDGKWGLKPSANGIRQGTPETDKNRGG